MQQRSDQRLADRSQVPYVHAYAAALRTCVAGCHFLSPRYELAKIKYQSHVQLVQASSISYIHVKTKELDPSA
jgi:hypothetical protein